MKAAPDAQRRLLDLQAVDTALTQLAHRRKNLPEHAELERLAGEISAMRDEHVRAQVAVDDLDRDIARLERDIDQVRQRADRDRQRLGSGHGTPKELESLQHELGTLGRRQGELEDEELELMEQRETAEAVVAEVSGRLETATAAQTAAETARDAALTEIAADEEKRKSQRGELAATIPADLLALYEKIRSSGGAGAALLRARRCGSCRLELSAQDIGRIRTSSPDEVERCDECRVILVRTEESGL